MPKVKWTNNDNNNLEEKIYDNIPALPPAIKLENAKDCLKLESHGILIICSSSVEKQIYWVGLALPETSILVCWYHYFPNLEC